MEYLCIGLVGACVLFVVIGLFRTHSHRVAASISPVPSHLVKDNGFLTEVGVRQIVGAAVKPDVMRTQPITGVLPLGESPGGQECGWLVRTPSYVFYYVDVRGSTKYPTALRFFVKKSGTNFAYQVHPDRGVIAFDGSQVYPACELKFATATGDPLDELAKLFEAEKNLPRLLLLRADMGPFDTTWLGHGNIGAVSIGTCEYNRILWPQADALQNGLLELLGEGGPRAGG